MHFLTTPRLAVLALLALLTACTHPDQPRDFVVYFQTDSADLTPTAQQVVVTAASRARDVSATKILVAGRADGNTAHDATLADQRATAVMQALSKQGIPAAQVEKQADAPPADRTGVAAHQVIITLLP
jgi:flagellar motor protein MotB